MFIDHLLENPYFFFIHFFPSSKYNSKFLSYLFVLIICEKFNVKSEEIAFIGDDVNDIALLKKVGLAASPNDGMEIVKEKCDYICNKNGGNGAFREIADLMLKSQF